MGPVFQGDSGESHTAAPAVQQEHSDNSLGQGTCDVPKKKFIGNVNIRNITFTIKAFDLNTFPSDAPAVLDFVYLFIYRCAPMRWLHR